MTALRLREQLGTLISGRAAKIALVHSTGKRMEVLWSIGNAHMETGVTLAWRGPYYLFGTQVPDELIPEILDLFERFCCQEHVEATTAE